MDPVVIVGAGISGLTIGHQLLQNGQQVIIVEKENDVGGLAKSFKYDDFTFDIGPHRFFSQDQEILDLIFSILLNDYNRILRYSGVYYCQRYHTWPLQPNATFSLPISVSLKSAWDLFLMSLRSRGAKTYNFEDYVLKNYGPTLYNTFFKDYTEKFLGLSPKDIHPDWAKASIGKAVINEDISSRNLFDILKLMFIKVNFPKTEFIYPKGGVGSFCDRVAQRIKECGGEIRTNNVITNIKLSSDKIEEITLASGGKICPKKVIWTGSLVKLCELLGYSSRSLSYLSLLLYNIEINKPLKKGYQWCYFGDKNIIFNRVSTPSMFDEGMSPKSKFGLCVEVTCQEGGQEWDEPESLVRQIKNCLKNVGLIDSFDETEEIHIEKIADAYPRYALLYQPDLEKVKNELSRLRNLTLAGRTGLFWYNNMDESIKNGLEVARVINEES
jgi:protoporphyrinogen oxidase